MATRANLLIVDNDNVVFQYYHHWDGYLSCVGEELRRFLVYAIGMELILKKVPFSSIILNELKSDYEYEYKMNINNVNNLHGDIEFLYVIKDKKLFYVNEYDLCNKYKSYKDLIKHVCSDKNELPLWITIDDKASM